MKKVIFACALVAGIGTLYSTSYGSPSATLYGTTYQYTNSSGGTTTQCPTSAKPCTNTTKNSDGSYSILIYQYDPITGEQIGIERIRTQMGENAWHENIEGGFINDAETTEGVLYGVQE